MLTVDDLYNIPIDKTAIYTAIVLTAIVIITLVALWLSYKRKNKQPR
jgi:hypothetical protein